MPSFIVESIEFDFEDSQGVLPPEEQKFITENALGVWHVEDEDELLEKISDTTGWLVSSCRYVPNQPHPLTSDLEALPQV